MLNKNINFKKNETESEIETPIHSFREINPYNCDELELDEEKKKAFLATFILLNKLSEYVYFYISENITSYTFVACFQNHRKPSVYL